MSGSWPPDTFTHLMQSVSVGIKGGGLSDGGAAANAEGQPAAGSRAKTYIRIRCCIVLPQPPQDQASALSRQRAARGRPPRARAAAAAAAACRRLTGSSRLLIAPVPTSVTTLPLNTQNQSERVTTSGTSAVASAPSAPRTDPAGSTDSSGTAAASGLTNAHSFDFTHAIRAGVRRTEPAIAPLSRQLTVRTAGGHTLHGGRIVSGNRTASSRRPRSDLSTSHSVTVRTAAGQTVRGGHIVPGSEPDAGSDVNSQDSPSQPVNHALQAGALTELHGMRHVPDPGSATQECPVCLGPLDDDDTVRLPCHRPTCACDRAK
eukprot:SAG25_NODE_925_length_4735_cov_64.253236_4_plen_318_part_00